MKMRILKQVKKVKRSTIQIHSKTQYTDIYRDMYRDNVKNVQSEKAHTVQHKHSIHISFALVHATYFVKTIMMLVSDIKIHIQ